MRIIVDHENNAEKFWENLTILEEKIKELRRLASVAVDPEDSWVPELLQRIPGFSEGPEYAPTALMFQEME